METRKGKVTKLYEEHDGWRYEIEVLAPAWDFKQATIVLPGEELDLDRLFAKRGDSQYEELISLSSAWMKEKPPFAIGDEVTVRFT
jgi:hypothetical protein